MAQINLTKEAAKAIRADIGEPMIIRFFKNINDEPFDDEVAAQFMIKARIRFMRSEKMLNWYWISSQELNRLENEFRIEFPDGHFEQKFFPKDDVTDHHPYSAFK